MGDDCGSEERGAVGRCVDGLGVPVELVRVCAHGRGWMASQLDDMRAMASSSGRCALTAARAGCDVQFVVSGSRGE
jgi:hypothetical protein